MITAEQLRALAKRASVDERTALRFLAGLPVRNLAFERLQTAAVALGLSSAPTIVKPAR